MGDEGKRVAAEMLTTSIRFLQFHLIIIFSVGLFLTAGRNRFLTTCTAGRPAGDRRCSTPSFLPVMISRDMRQRRPGRRPWVRTTTTGLPEKKEKC